MTPKCLTPYFGGMTNCADHYLKNMPFPIDDYREACVGGGSVFTKVVTTQGAVPRHVTLNDADPSTFAMWAATAWYTEQLKEAVRGFPATDPEQGSRIRAKFLAGLSPPTSAQDIVQIGVEKMFIQYNSFQSLGQQAGPRRTPIRDTGTSINWNREAICDKIDWYSVHLRGANITNCDFSPSFEGAGAVVFVDPPFYQIGADHHTDAQKHKDARRAYQYSFSEGDHFRLRDCCHETAHHVVLSYDDSPFIRRLYEDATVNAVETYYHASGRRTTKLVIVLPAKPRLFVFLPTPLLLTAA